MIRKFIAAFVIIFFAASTTAFAAEKIKEGLDWDKGLYIVEGNALGPFILDNRERFYKNLARQGARLDALRMLADFVGSYGKGEEKGEIIMRNISADKLKFQIIEKGAKQIGDAVFSDDGICTLYMGLPLFGENSLAQAYLLGLKNRPKENFPKPANVENISEKYTGLIVDCRGFKIWRYFTPFICYKISEEKSETIYAAKYLDFNKIGDTFIHQGLASYVRDMKDAARAGKKPLIVKAVSGGFDTYVSVADADKILNANKVSGFLDRSAVVFLCDSFFD